MSETRKLAAILVADVVGYSRLAGADEDRTLARLRSLRSDLIEPAIAVHHGRTVKGTGDGSIVEFRSVVDAVGCAIEVQTAMIERNAGVAPEKRIELRIGIHVGDVVEEADGDLMGDSVNIAARLEGVAKPGGVCLSEQAFWQIRGRLVKTAVVDLGAMRLKNIAEPIRVFSLDVAQAALAKPAAPAPERREPPAPFACGAALRQHRRRFRTRVFRRRGDGEPHDRPLTHMGRFRDRTQHGIHLQGQSRGREAGRTRARRALHPRRQRTTRRQPYSRQRTVGRR